MATQQLEKPQKHKFLRWVCIVAFVFAVILLAGAGYSWLTKVWGDQTNTLSAIFSISGTFFSLIGLLSFFFSSRDSRASSSSHPSQQFTINTYVNSPQINSQQPLSQQSTDAHDRSADIEPGRQQITPPDQQLPQSERFASPIHGTPPTFVQTPAGKIPFDGFPERANKGPVMKLTNQERLNLTDAILDAYPNQEDFEMMFEVRCNRKLNTLVDGYSNYRTRIFRLIERTEAEGWTYDLVIAAHEERPLNSALQSWGLKYKAAKETPEAQKPTSISPGIVEPPQDSQAITAEQERQKQQKTDAPPDPGVQRGQKSKQAPPIEQALEQARESLREAHDAVHRSKVIFEGRGDIQQIHYLQATAALRQVASCVQNLHNGLQTISFLPAHLDRERLIMDLRHISTEAGESIKQIANYGTHNAHQRERNRKDTASRLSTVLNHMDNLGRNLISKDPCS